MHAAAVALVAAGMTVVMGVVSSTGWAGYLVGAVFAALLWLIVFCGTLAGPKDLSLSERVPARSYAVAAAFALLIGGATVWLTENTAFWSVGVIMAGVLTPTIDRARRDASPS